MLNSAFINLDSKESRQLFFRAEIVKRITLVKKILVLISKLKQLKAEKLNSSQASNNVNLTAKAESRIALQYLIDIDLLEALLKELEECIEDCEEYLSTVEYEDYMNLYNKAAELTCGFENNELSFSLGSVL